MGGGGSCGTRNVLVCTYDVHARLLKYQEWALRVVIERTIIKMIGGDRGDKGGLCAADIAIFQQGEIRSSGEHRLDVSTHFLSKGKSGESPFFHCCEVLQSRHVHTLARAVVVEVTFRPHDHGEAWARAVG